MDYLRMDGECIIYGTQRSEQRTFRRDPDEIVGIVRDLG